MTYIEAKREVEMSHLCVSPFFMKEIKETILTVYTTHVTNYLSVNKTRIYPRIISNIMVIQTLIMFVIS